MKEALPEVVVADLQMPRIGTVWGGSSPPESPIATCRSFW
jgi:hypothetical protein